MWPNPAAPCLLTATSSHMEEGGHGMHTGAVIRVNRPKRRAKNHSIVCGRSLERVRRVSVKSVAKLPPLRWLLRVDSLLLPSSLSFSRFNLPLQVFRSLLYRLRREGKNNPNSSFFFFFFSVKFNFLPLGRHYSRRCSLCGCECNAAFNASLLGFVTLPT